MKLRTFIDRPILACVISALILLVGLIGLTNLPMEQYPDIAPPTIRVSTTYTGANAETVQKSVVVPLEEATGTLGEDSENTFQYALKYRGRYETSEEFGAASG